jgi:hypothetical protein
MEADMLGLNSEQSEFKNSQQRVKFQQPGGMGREEVRMRVLGCHTPVECGVGRGGRWEEDK